MNRVFWLLRSFVSLSGEKNNTVLGESTVMLAGAREKGRLLSSCFASAFSRKENDFQKEKDRNNIRKRELKPR